MNRYFLYEQCLILQNHPWVKDTFKVQDKPMDFNVKEYENFIEMISDSTLLLTFKKSLLIEFGCSTKEQNQNF